MQGDRAQSLTEYACSGEEVSWEGGELEMQERTGEDDEGGGLWR